NERPVAVNSPRKKRRVFVVGWHDDTKPLKAPKILSQSERNSWASARIGCVSDYVLLQFGHENNTRVLNPPDFFGIIDGAGHQCRFAINLPAIHSVSRACGAKMG